MQWYIMLPANRLTEKTKIEHLHLSTDAPTPIAYASIIQTAPRESKVKSEKQVQRGMFALSKTLYTMWNG